MSAHDELTATVQVAAEPCRDPKCLPGRMLKRPHKHVLDAIAQPTATPDQPESLPGRNLEES